MNTLLAGAFAIGMVGGCSNHSDPQSLDAPPADSADDGGAGGESVAANVGGEGGAADPGACAPQPLAQPVSVAEGTVNGSAFFYSAPDEPTALLTVFHGSGGAKDDMVWRPELMLLIADAHEAGYAVAALDSAAHLSLPGPTYKWNTEDGADNVDVVNAKAMIARLKSPDDLGIVPPDAPVFALGASNGGTFVSRLAQHYDLNAAVIFISNAQRFHEDGVVVPPLVLVPGANDSTVAAASMEVVYSRALALDVDAELFLNLPAPLSPEYFTRLEGIDCALSQVIVGNLRDVGLIDESGVLLSSPLEPGWHDAVPGEHLAEVRDELVELYAEHAVTSEFDLKIIAFLEAHRGGKAYMTKRAIVDAEDRLALCNDGTSAVYYSRRGSGAGADKWVVGLEGGSMCASAGSCAQRWFDSRDLMSSEVPSEYPAVLEKEGLYDADPADNPAFHNWNVVRLRYCSSDLWTGDTLFDDDTLLPASQPQQWHFRGKRIVKAVVQDLMNPTRTAAPTISSASTVLFMGHSAGSHGMTHNLDAVASLLPNAEVIGVNDAAFFRPVEGPDETPEYVAQAHATAAFHDFQPDVSCWTNEPVVTRHRCYDSVYVAQNHLSHDFFVHMDQSDTKALEKLKPGQTAEQMAAGIRELCAELDGAYCPDWGFHVSLDKPRFNGANGYELPFEDSFYPAHDVLRNFVFGTPGPTVVVEP